MKHPIIKTDNYLFVVDDSEIKEGDWHYNLALNLVEKTTPFDNGLLQQKIIAHLPLNGSLTLEGVDLLPPLVHPNCCVAKDGGLNNMNRGCAERNRCLPPLEDDVIKLSYEVTNGKNFANGVHEEIVAQMFFRKGYNKAKEKYKYTEEDLKKAWKEGYNERNLDDFIESLQQPKIPIGFKCVDKIYRVKSGTIQEHIDSLAGYEYYEWVGEYIYE